MGADLFFYFGDSLLEGFGPGFSDPDLELDPNPKLSPSSSNNWCRSVLQAPKSTFQFQSLFRSHGPPAGNWRTEVPVGPFSG